MTTVVLLIFLLGPTVLLGQPFSTNLLECGNLSSGICRLQCLPSELSVYPYTCSIYTYIYGVTYNRCVTSMPCCYWRGSCQGSCASGQIQLGYEATCSNIGDVCCVPSELTEITTTTTAAPANTVAGRQGVCGSAVPGRSETRYFVQPRILGGSIAQAGNWPWMARIIYTTSSGFCAGVLVDNDTVVTVAHCLAGVPQENMRVILADYDLSTFNIDEDSVAVKSYYIVSSFVRGTRGNDFGLLKLARYITFTDRKLPACLPDPTIPLQSPPSCYIAGWGVSEGGVGGRLREANVQLLDRQTCAERLTSSDLSPVVLPSDIICTDNPIGATTDGCLFDDGDMLVCRDWKQRWSLVGLMSEYSCGGGLPVLFTDMRNYTDATLDRL